MHCHRPWSPQNPNQVFSHAWHPTCLRGYGSLLPQPSPRPPNQQIALQTPLTVKSNPKEFKYVSRKAPLQQPRLSPTRRGLWFPEAAFRLRNCLSLLSCATLCLRLNIFLFVGVIACWCWANLKMQFLRSYYLVFRRKKLTKIKINK